MNLNLKEIKSFWAMEEAITHNKGYSLNKKITVDWLIAQIEKLEKTLNYYADMNLYRMTAGGSYFIQEMPAGTRARKALEELNG